MIKVNLQQRKAAVGVAASGSSSSSSSGPGWRGILEKFQSAGAQGFADGDKRAVVILVAIYTVILGAGYWYSSERKSQLIAAIDADTVYGDVGRALPEIYVIYNTRIADVGGTAERDGAVALIREELAGLDHTTPVVILTARRRA